jgi:hypothetical protein
MHSLSLFIIQPPIFEYYLKATNEMKADVI